jgi:hypothetical protein
MSGIGFGAAANGFVGGMQAGSNIMDQKRRAEGRDEDRAYRRERDGIADERWQKTYDQNQQMLDLNTELKGLQINVAKDENLMKRGQHISKAMRAAMSGPDGSSFDFKAFQGLPEEEQSRRIGIVNQGMTWMNNEAGFLKGYLGSNPASSINAEKPVAGYQMMQSNQGNLGVRLHLNRKDGRTGGFDYPDREEGMVSTVPIDVFSDMVRQTTGVFLDNKMTEQQKLGLQHKNSMAEIDQRNKNARGLEDLKYSYRDPKDSRTPMRKNMEYLIEAGVAKTPAQALSFVQKAKSSPVKLISDMVQSSEENQLLYNIKPGDPRHRSREQMINEAMTLIDQINGKAGQPQGQPASDQQQGGGLPPQAAAVLKEGQATTFGNGQKWMLQNGQPIQVQ